jgi:hypothetical protein
MQLTGAEETKSRGFISFSDWLSRQSSREDPVGCVSRDAEVWGDVAERDDFLAMGRMLLSSHADTSAFRAFILAWSEFTRVRPKMRPVLPCFFCGSPMSRFDSDICGDSSILFTPTLAHTRCVDTRKESGVRIFFQLSRSEPTVLDRVSEWSSAFLLEKGEDSSFWKEYADRETETFRQILLLSGLGTLPLVSEPSQAESSFVYFIRQGEKGPIKIGFAADPQKRKQQLQTSSSDTLHTLLVLPGTFQTEAHYHARFATLRLRGEWFRPEPELLEFIEKTRAENLARLP